ncbi:uncharacterized protein LOC127834157 [Dreissena polymorpha]|uniref:uncharacterized protein LOC127834157 n=1 Tax=Dreissena polymorpha TaxID=45954 RepID=UPI0022651707|nr:uncharacterized protein LOC127834157 [Dreissena polymorpha]
MLRINLYRLRSKAEALLAGEQAGVRARRSTVEHIFNCRIIIEKHPKHKRELFYNFIHLTSLKKAFERVWHDRLWHVMRGFTIDKGPVEVIQDLNGNASSAVLLNGRTASRLREISGRVRQGCFSLSCPV